MPHLPSGASPHITAGIPLERLASWINGEARIPNQGPHTASNGQFGFTITKDFDSSATRSTFRKGMQGHWLEETTTKAGDRKVKIFIEGVTEYWGLDPKTGQKVWLKNQWVPADCVEKGRPWKDDLEDWSMTIETERYQFDAAQWLGETPPDTSVLGRTVTALITALHNEPASFLGSQLQELVQKRDIQTICKIIIKGVKDAGVYDVLNRNNFTVANLVSASLEVMLDGYRTDKGGIYI